MPVAGKIVRKMKCLYLLPRTWMTGEDNGHMLGQFSESTHDCFQRLETIDIAGAMQGDQPIRLLSYPQPCENIGVCCLISVFEQGVDHHVPNKINFLWRNAFS